MLLLTLALLAAPTPMQTPTCKAAQLSLTFDSENGNFDGMSHSGTLLVLRNFSDTACTVLPRPQLTFEDAAHKPVAFQPAPTPGMHPGPVQVPVIIPAGAEVTGELRWVSGDVYDGHKCVTPAFVTLALGSESLRAPFAAHACGPAAKPVSYTVTWLHRDPPLKREASFWSTAPESLYWHSFLYFSLNPEQRDTPLGSQPHNRIHLHG